VTYLPDGFPDQLEVASLSDSAAWLYIRALCFCDRNGRGDRLTRRDLASLLSKPRLVAELLDASLLELDVDGGAIVRRPAKDPPTAGQIEARRERDRIRKAAHRRRDTNPLCHTPQGVTLGVTDSVTPGVTPGVTAGVTPEVCAHSPDLSISGSGIPEVFPASKPSSETGQVARASKNGAAKPGRKAKREAWREAQRTLTPDETHRRIASEMRVDLELELAKFRDHDFARPREDAAATFRNWLRGARPAPTGLNGKPPGLVDHEAQRLEANTAARHRAWLLEQARAGDFGAKLQAMAEAGKLELPKLEAWYERQRTKQAPAAAGGPGSPTPLGGLLATAVGGRQAPDAR
jgi:hypothetical protein